MQHINTLAAIQQILINEYGITVNLAQSNNGAHLLDIANETSYDIHGSFLNINDPKTHMLTLHEQRIVLWGGPHESPNYFDLGDPNVFVKIAKLVTANHYVKL